jgi:hypothetical protein
MNELLVVGGSIVLCALVTVIAVWLDDRAVKREDRLQKRRRPVVPDFTKAKR